MGLCGVGIDRRAWGLGFTVYRLKRFKARAKRFGFGVWGASSCSHWRPWYLRRSFKHKLQTLAFTMLLPLGD